MTLMTLYERVAQLSNEARQQLATNLDASVNARASQSSSAATQHSTTLVAYYVSTSGQELRASDLRQFLDTSLPAHLVPSLFRRIDRIPRTLHGKIDAKALPDPRSASSVVSQTSDAASTAIEDELLTLWKAALGIKRLGRTDSFFELGGDSLLAIRLLGQIRERWSIELSMTDLFNAPTVAGAATQVESVLWARDSGRNRNAAGGAEQEVVEF
jgi:acyl carrier protein